MNDIKYGEILEPESEKARAENEQTVREGFWGKLKRTVARIPFARDAVAAYYCATDSDTPVGSRVVLYSALAYFIMPVDLIPDVFVFVGFSDDLAVLTAAIAMISRSMKLEHYQRADNTLIAIGKP